MDPENLYERRYDPFSVGELKAQVAGLEKQMDKLEIKLEQLLELANRSKGAFWIGMTLAGVFSSVIGFFASIFWHKP